MLQSKLGEVKHEIGVWTRALKVQRRAGFEKVEKTTESVLGKVRDREEPVNEDSCQSARQCGWGIDLT